MTCHNCGGSGHYSSACSKPSLCANCGRKGHKKMECPQGDGKNLVCSNCGERRSKAAPTAGRRAARSKWGDHSG